MHEGTAGHASPRRSTWWERQRAALPIAAPYLLLGLVPVLFWIGALITVAGKGGIAFDFHQYFFPQARDVLHGRAPATAYPPLTTLLYLPFALLPAEAADWVITVTMVACAAGTLWLLGIRDWRCYGAASLWPPVYDGVQTGNLSLVLVLGVAAMWRWRDRALPAGSALAVVIALKLFLWPLAVWPLLTSRSRAAAVMVAVGLLASAAAWAVVGFDALLQLPALLKGNVEDNGTRPYTVTALLRELGVSTPLALAVCWSLGVAVAVAGVRWARAGDEAGALGLLIGAALLVSPIVWLHYLSLLLVPVALSRPRFSALWLVPLPLIVCERPAGTIAEKVLLLGVGAVVLAWAVLPAHRRSRSTASPALAS
jgi:alpha-1,2-mannosyltransferase